MELVNEPGIAESLTGLAAVAAVAAVAGQRELAEESMEAVRAVRLFGASDAIRETTGAAMWPAERADFERNMAIARARLDTETWQNAWDAGRAMSVDQAIVYARGSNAGQ